MKNAKKIKGIGELLMILGSAMYVLELVASSGWSLTLPICCVYAVSLVLMGIGWYGMKDERRAAKEAAKAEKAKNKEAA